MVRDGDEHELAQLLKTALSLPESRPPEEVVAAMVSARRAGVQARRRRWLAFAAGVLVIGALASRPLFIGRPPLLAVVAAQAATTGRGQEVRIGDRLPSGVVVRTAKGGRVDLVTRRGSEFALNGDSELAFAPDGRAASLRRGRLYLRNRGHEFAAVTTEAGRIELLGTTISADVRDPGSVAVTVVEGKVRLENARGRAVVEAGTQSVLRLAAAPQPGAAVNVAAELAWYQGRSNVLSDFGDIVYTLCPAKGFYTEVWAMHPDGSGKHRLRSYLGRTSPDTTGWLPEAQQLLVNTRSVILGAPDLKTRTIDTHYGHPVMGDELWLLNAATGQSAPTHLPFGFGVIYSQVSPDGARVAFTGWHKPDPRSAKGQESGIWIYDFATGQLRKVADGPFVAALAWSPDGRTFVISSARYYGDEDHLLRLNATTRAVTDLGLPGADAAFSPDGAKLAYSAEFAKSSSWMGGVPTSGSIWVADLAAGPTPRRISPPHEGALHPQWSPDGTRVAYLIVRFGREQGKHTSHSTLRAARADGSGVTTLRDVDRRILAFAWAPAGDQVYAVTGSALGSAGVSVAAADGSGRVTDLGGTKEDSLLSDEDRRQTDGAAKALQEAFFQLVTGEIAQLDGKLAESRAAFRAAADIFAGLTWQYPRSGFSPDDVIRYADEAVRRAEEPAASALHEACRQDLDGLSGWLWRFVDANGRLPVDLAELRDWMVHARHEKAADIAALFSCPVGAEAGPPTPYAYNAHASEGHLKPGDVIVSCPEHPDLKIAWDKNFLARLGEVAAIPRDRLQQLGELP